MQLPSKVQPAEMCLAVVDKPIQLSWTWSPGQPLCRQHRHSTWWSAERHINTTNSSLESQQILGKA